MARPARAGGIVKRVQIDMPDAALKRLQRLQVITESSSYAEVVKNALRLYEALIDEKENGGDVLVRRKDGTEVLTIFAT
jgi:hypothetical protein